MRLALLLLIIILALSTPAPSFALPLLPSSFYGTVKMNGLNLAEGTPVSAWIGGIQIIQTTSVLFNGESVFSLNVPGDDLTTSEIEGGVEGAVITFYIAGQPATPTAVWHSGTNASVNLNTQGGYKIYLPEVSS